MDFQMSPVPAETGAGCTVENVFAAARARLPGAGPVLDIRTRAFEIYERAGLPRRRIENRKYTDPRMLMRDVLPLAAHPDAAALARARDAVQQAAIERAAKLVLVDGAFTPGLSDLAELESGIELRTLREVLESAAADAMAGLVLSTRDDPVISLNTAMVTDGLVMTVAAGSALNRPIQIIHVATGSSASSFTRSYLHLGNRAHVALVESFDTAEGASGYQANDLMIALLGDEAVLSHLRVAADAADAVNISSGITAVGANAKLNLFNMTDSGALSRYQAFITLAGEGTELSANGVNLIKNEQYADAALVVDHAAPHCRSREKFRTVVNDHARSVFRGRIIVRPGARRTDGKLTARALLLSDQAEADLKPELEIMADDVTCGHGATLGTLDRNLLFYLRARGLSEFDAQTLLIEAFVGEAVEEIDNDSLRNYAVGQIQRWLEARR